MTPNVRALPDQSTDTGVINDKYSYDANANVTGIADLLPTSVSSRTMTYDALNRLSTVSAPNMWGNATYTYDTLDNLTTTTITGGSTARSSVHTINATTNRLDTISGGPAAFNFIYSYDSQGNIILRGSQAYVFDQGNRMKSATGKATYGYDGLGHRVSVVGTDGVNRVQVYSQGGQLLYIAPSGGAATKYIYLHNHVLAEQNGTTVTYNHTDGLGSPVAQSNAAGQVVNPTRYEPYGYITAGTPRTLGFTGHVSDSDTGLTYMQQRYYDPIAGRMLSIDPVTTDSNTGGSFNRYVYGNNSPYKYIDPDGRQARGIDVYCPPVTCQTYGSSPGEIGASLRAGFVSTVVNPLRNTIEASKDTLDDWWESYLAQRQASADRMSAAMQGDKAAADQIAREFALGFVGSTSMKIAGGHAFEKHVLGVGARIEDGLFRGLGIRPIGTQNRQLL